VHVRHWHVLALIPQSSLVLHLWSARRSCMWQADSTRALLGSASGHTIALSGLAPPGLPHVGSNLGLGSHRSEPSGWACMEGNRCPSVVKT